MKPLKLTMTAFGPFAKKTVIDFEKIGRQGVFLISGNNGSGKTSIFDAISYALYGETSNKDRRDSKSVHSDFTSEDTYVSLVFSHQGKIYEAERGGKIKTTKGQRKFETSDPSFSLLRADGTKQVIIDRGVKDVNQTIKNTIGIGREQFAQTVMIAQGEFQKIVDANSKDRIPLFRSLFHTEIYDKFKEELQKRSKEYSIVSTQKQTAVQNEMNRADFSVRYAPSVAPEIGNAELYLDCLNQQNQDDEKELSGKKALKETAYRELQTCIEQFTKGENQNKLLDEFESKKQEYRKLEALKKPMTEKYERLKKANNAENVREYQEKLQSSEKNLSDEEAMKHNLSEKYDFQCGALKQAESALQEAEKAAQILETLRQNADELNKALPLFSERDKAEGAYLAAQKQFKNWNQLYQKENQKYETLSEAYFSGQAGIMASRLKADEPCPVCGSTVHPKLAILERSVPSKEDVDKAEQSRNHANEQRSEASRNTAVKKERWETLCKNPVLQNGKDEITVRQELSACQEQIYVLEQNRETARDVYHHCKSEQNATDVQLKDIEGRIQKLKQSIQHQKKEYENALEQNGFADENAYLSSLLDRASMESLNRDINQYTTEWKSVSSRLKELKAETENMQYINLMELGEKKQQTDDTYRNLEMLCNQIDKRLENNQKTASRLQKTIQDWYAHQKEGGIEKMYRVVNGSMEKSVKISLEAYAQQYYFRHVVSHARKQLMKLTGGKFDLRCKETPKNQSEKFGLGLEVLDMKTNQWRDVKTLSGGESFLTSLSLALGMSDVAQENSGGIQIDAMFIDEGFGSLDAEALNEAINLLGRLADGKRLIGVISHVEALKNRIEYQVCVTKKNDGSVISFSGIS